MENEKGSMITYSEKELRKILRIVGTFSNGNLQAICPKCGRKEFGISIKKKGNPFQCFRKNKCGISGNIFSLARLLGLSLDDVVYNSKIERVTFKKSKKEDVVEHIVNYKLPMGFRQENDDEYLRSRGFTDDDFKKYVVGSSRISTKLIGYKIIGLKFFGELYGHVARNTHSKEYCDENKLKRYLNSSNNISDFLDGLEEFDNQESFSLSEGIFDRIAIRNNLENKVLSLCTYGAKLSKPQLHLLKMLGIKRCYESFDPDVPQIKDKTAKALILEGFEVFRPKFINSKDPDEHSKKELENAFRNSEKVCIFTNSLKKLKI